MVLAFTTGLPYGIHYEDTIMEAQSIMAENDKDDNDNKDMSPQADLRRRLDHATIIKNMPPVDPRDRSPAQDRQDARLTLHERKELVRCEATIERALVSQFEAGAALKVIRKQKLYRGSRNALGQVYQNFDAYCDGRWSFGAGRARQLIGGHEVFENIRTATAVAPRNEGVVRSLVRLHDPADQRRVWTISVQRFGNPTQAQVLAVRDEVIVVEQSPDDSQPDEEEATAWDEKKRLVWQETCNRIDECARWLNSQPELDNLLTEEGQNCLRRTIAALQDWLRFF